MFRSPWVTVLPTFVISSLLVGCAVAPVNSIDIKATSPVDIANHFYQKTDERIYSGLQSKISNNGPSRTFSYSWCTSNANYSISELANLLDKKCSDLGGMLYRHWCISSTDTPLYSFHLESGGASQYCLPGSDYFSAIVIQKSPSTSASDWLTYAETHGFETDSEIAREYKEQVQREAITRHKRIELETRITKEEDRLVAGETKYLNAIRQEAIGACAGLGARRVPTYELLSIEGIYDDAVAAAESPREAAKAIMAGQITAHTWYQAREAARESGRVQEGQPFSPYATPLYDTSFCRGVKAQETARS